MCTNESDSQYQEIKIDSEDPFKNDCLGRETIADNLTNIINANKTNVTSISSTWGTGKTTFCKMWVQKLKNYGYTAIYYDAFLHDYFDNPLISIIGAIKEYLHNPANVAFKDVKTVVWELSKNAISLITKGLVDVEKIHTELNATGIRPYIDNYFQSHSEIREIKKALTAIKQQISPDSRIFFFIDELDRCNPNFVLDLLELIKHLFQINGYSFILLIDKTQLSNIIKSRYGEFEQENDFIKKFIDLEYYLPSANTENYIDIKLENPTLNLPPCIDTLFISILKVLSNHYNLTLRDLDKLFYFLIIMCSISEPLKTSYNNPAADYLVKSTYAFLLVLKIKNPELFVGMMTGESSVLNTFNDYISGLVITSTNSTYDNSIIKTLKQILPKHMKKEFPDKNTFTLKPSQGGHETRINFLFSDENYFIPYYDFNFLINFGPESEA